MKILVVTAALLLPGLFTNAAETQGHCFRFIDSELGALKDSACRLPLAEVISHMKPLAAVQIQYEELLKHLAAPGNGSNLRAVQNFFESIRESLWSSEDREMLTAVFEAHPTAAPTVNFAEQMKTGQIRRLMPSFPVMKGWEDMQVQTIALESESDDFVQSSVEPRQWMLFSSVFQPLVVWGTYAQLEEKRSRHYTTWLSGDCKSPKMADGFEFTVPVRGIANESCATGNLMMAANPTQQVDPFQSRDLPSGPHSLETSAFAESSTKTKIDSSWSRGTWILVGVAAAGVIYAMKDKTIVIQKGFRF